MNCAVVVTARDGTILAVAAHHAAFTRITGVIAASNNGTVVAHYTADIYIIAANITIIIATRDNGWTVV